MNSLHNIGKHSRLAGRQRRSSGAVSIEFILLVPLFVVLAIVGVSCYLTLLATWMNDSACRDACRAAAQQTNAEDAKAAAQASCKRFSCGSFGAPEISLKDSDFEYQTFPKADGTPELEKGPFVKITTTADGTMIGQISFMRAFFGGDITLRRTYVYPLVNNSGSAEEP